MSIEQERYLYAELMKGMAEILVRSLAGGDRVIDRADETEFDDCCDRLQQIDCAHELDKLGLIGKLVKIAEVDQIEERAVKNEDFDLYLLDVSFSNFLDLSYHRGVPILTREAFVPPDYLESLFGQLAKMSYGVWDETLFQWSSKIERHMWSRRIWKGKEAEDLQSFVEQMLANRPNNFDQLVRKEIHRSIGRAIDELTDNWQVNGRWVEHDLSKRSWRMSYDYGPVREHLMNRLRDQIDWTYRPPSDDS